jgi:hypothetical protein
VQGTGERFAGTRYDDRPSNLLRYHSGRVWVNFTRQLSGSVVDGQVKDWRLDFTDRLSALDQPIDFLQHSLFNPNLAADRADLCRHILEHKVKRLRYTRVEQ